MRVSIVYILSGITLLVCLHRPLAASQFEEAQSAMRQLVELRVTYGQEDAQWREQQESLNHMIALLERQKQEMSAQLDQIDESQSTANQEREALLNRSEKAQRSLQRITQRLGRLEQTVLKLSEQFPPPLTQRIQPFLRRLNDASNTTLSERLQAVVGILTEAGKFNSTITLYESVEQLEGRQLAVSTLYWGLAGGWFTDASGKFAGVVHWRDGRWNYQLIAQSGTRVLQAIAIHEGRASAELVTLPIPGHTKGGAQ